MAGTGKILNPGVKQNDYQNFNHLFFKHYAPLCSYVAAIIDDPSASEDIVQNLFVKFWTDREKISVHSNIEHYLFRAAKNSALNHLRSETNRKKTMDKLAALGCFNETGHNEREDFLQELEKCINQLPGRSKEVLLLNRFEGLKQKEIAEKLNISVQTIKNQIWKSLKYLKSCMETKNVF